MNLSIKDNVKSQYKHLLGGIDDQILNSPEIPRKLYELLLCSQQIMDFLDGRILGMDLFQQLYVYYIGPLYAVVTM